MIIAPSKRDLLAYDAVWLVLVYSCACFQKTDKHAVHNSYASFILIPPKYRTDTQIVQLFCNQKVELPYADKIQNQLNCMINKALKSSSKKKSPRITKDTRALLYKNFSKASRHPSHANQMRCYQRVVNCSYLESSWIQQSYTTSSII